LGKDALTGALAVMDATVKAQKFTVIFEYALPNKDNAETASGGVLAASGGTVGAMGGAATMGGSTTGGASVGGANNGAGGVSSAGMAGTSTSGGANTSGGVSTSGGASTGGGAGAPSSGPHNIAFVTSEYFTGQQIGGLSGADEHCKRLALAADLGDHGWRAWLSTQGGEGTADDVAAKDRIGNTARGWVRPDGAPLVDLLADLLQGKLLHPLLIDETGTAQKSEVWSATQMDGTLAPGVTNGLLSCGDWLSDTGDAVTGFSYSVGLLWTQNFNALCNKARPLYCFSTDRTTPLTVTKAVGRLAFTSEATFNASTGLAGADLQCQAEATAAALPGTYKALLTTQAMPAHQRFNLTGMPWVRPDGIAWLPDPTTLSTFTGAATALNMSANGTFLATDAYRFAFMGIPGDTCLDWSSVGTDAYATFGGVQSATRDSFGCCSGPCNNSANHYLYCLQE